MQPGGAEPQELADLSAFDVVAFAFRKTVQLFGHFHLRLWQFSTHYLGSEGVEKIQEGFNVVGIHFSKLDTREIGFCKKRSKIIYRRFLKFFENARISRV